MFFMRTLSLVIVVVCVATSTLFAASHDSHICPCETSTLAPESRFSNKKMTETRKDKPASESNDIIAANVVSLSSDQFKTALTGESMGGNAGPGHAAVNGVVDKDGRFVIFGNWQDYPPEIKNEIKEGRLYAFTIRVKIGTRLDIPFMDQFLLADVWVDQSLMANVSVERFRHDRVSLHVNEILLLSAQSFNEKQNKRILEQTRLKLKSKPIPIPAVQSPAEIQQIVHEIMNLLYDVQPAGAPIMIAKSEYQHKKELTPGPEFIEKAKGLLSVDGIKPLHDKVYRLEPGTRVHDEFLRFFINELKALPFENEVGETKLMRRDAREVVMRLIAYVEQKATQKTKWSMQEYSKIKDIFEGRRLEVFKNELYPEHGIDGICYNLDLSVWGDLSAIGLPRMPNEIILERFYIMARTEKLKGYYNGKITLRLDGTLLVDLSKDDLLNMHESMVRPAIPQDMNSDLKLDQFTATYQ